MEQRDERHNSSLSTINFAKQVSKLDLGQIFLERPLLERLKTV